MATRIHIALIEINANDIMKQAYKISKQLQDLHVDVTLFSETHPKPRERLFISNFIEPTATRAEKTELPLRLEEAFSITL
jgi:hypothetical protein